MDSNSQFAPGAGASVDPKLRARDRKLAGSPVVHQLLMALALRNENVMTRVFHSDDADTVLAAAKDQLDLILQANPGKCPEGSMWSDKLGRCVPIILGATQA
jgi:hypothetical protein